MLKASIFALLFIVVRLPGNTTQPPTPPPSTLDTVYLAAVREFARAMVQASEDSTPPFFLEDSIDPGSYFDYLNSCLRD